MDNAAPPQSIARPPNRAVTQTASAYRVTDQLDRCGVRLGPTVGIKLIPTTLSFETNRDRMFFQTRRTVRDVVGNTFGEKPLPDKTS